jgi:CubicO group peptidase (beta-lactamase class C family)
MRVTGLSPGDPIGARHGPVRCWDLRRDPAIIVGVPVSRRTVLGAGLACVASLAGCGEPPRPGITPVAGTPAPSAPAVPSTSPPSTPPPVPAYVKTLPATLSRYLKPYPGNPKHPGYAGAVALVTVDGRVTAHTAVGHALRYGAGPVELPTSRRVAMRKDSIFDLASITKVYTALLVLQLVDAGAVGLDKPVRTYLPEFTGTGKAAVTVAMLLAHTGALPVGATVTGHPTRAAQRRAVLATPLVKGGVPGRTFRYSSVGLMVLGQLVEKVTGKALDVALRDAVTGPLALTDTGFKPLTWLGATARADRLVATDARSSRGLLRGTVQDDVCNRLGGVAGHAGIFATAKDLAVIGQMLLNGGEHNGTRILSEQIVTRMLTDVNSGRPAIDAERPNRTSTHGLGVEIDQPWFMGRLASPAAFGHTGFSGTSLLVDRSRKLVLVLLTNRAHPNWSWSNPDPIRAAVANLLV